MQRIFFSVTFLLCFLLSYSVSISQVSTFDTSYVICSSKHFDYTNPKTVKSGYYYYLSKNWLAYEKKSSSYSNIVIREMAYDDYEPEIMITNDTNCFNLNPSFDNNIIVWQSNKYGNWDIFFSLYNNGIWTQPLRIDSTSSDETEPFVLYKSSGLIQNVFYYLTFRRDNDIGFKKFNVSEGKWAGDTIITASINETCLNPLILPILFYEYKVCFLKQVNDSTRRISYKSFEELNNPYHISWLHSVEIYQPKTQENLGFSWGYYALYLTYDYDTLNAVHTVGAENGIFSSINVFTKIPSGKNIQGKGIEPYIGISLPSDPPNFNAFEFAAFAFIRQSNDSTMMCASKEYYENSNPPIKRFYVGDENTELKFVITPRSFTTDHWYKVRVIWEQEINNKIALVETYMTDFITHYTNNPQRYSLLQNYPNPFNPITNILFEIPCNSPVKLTIYDILGKKITSLANGNLKVGRYEVDWDASGYPDGVYFYKLETKDFSEVRKMVLLK